MQKIKHFTRFHLLGSPLYTNTSFSHEKQVISSIMLYIINTGTVIVGVISKTFVAALTSAPAAVSW
jgi:hypothetical protein